MSFWEQLGDHLSRGEPAFVAIVGDHTRHSPGTRGAKMFIRPNGRQVGTIGGGAMEASFVERAAAAFDGNSMRNVETLHHREDAEGTKSGLICAGRQTVAYFVAKPEHAKVYTEFANARDAGEVELVISDGVPEIREAEVGQRAPLGLEGDTYFEHAINHRRVAIAGGGHCGVALSRTLTALGYCVTVFETRPDVFTLRKVTADRIITVPDYVEIGEHVEFPELTHFIVMTADMPSDIRALLGLKDVDSPFKGVMGSAAKIARIKAALREAGAGSVADELYAPIGLEMTSNTPEEIAISVAGQLLRVRESLFAWECPSPLS